MPGISLRGLRNSSTSGNRHFRCRPHFSEGSKGQSSASSPVFGKPNGDLICHSYWDVKQNNLSTGNKVYGRERRMVLHYGFSSGLCRRWKEGKVLTRPLKRAVSSLRSS
ncbi:hypothetical protein MPTK1_1g19600 [Marchantia polymorpha subsp. ruderalis]|uniref:Uncharacterized protein n=2 Tax=Marchantia polymorpha TaxID=3197 RepID=A0AAF6ARZ2_MARPO|nr:hypothetical protein MARPO_0001s0299 [Marchantia polymorpha]BBM99212.1 hypothetical protein Mp_1g19600 [Marchantia polymorpha subsp. ruderalis]|eukprot:PTQ50292.1 hypothetical protein MARPO_0001s0299 [Marchantia polymorpha]